MMGGAADAISDGMLTRTRTHLHARLPFLVDTQPLKRFTTCSHKALTLRLRLCEMAEKLLV